MARFLLDEHIARSTVERLRRLGNDVKWVPEEGLAGADDDELFDLAVAEKRITLSFDDYFGKRAYLETDRPLGVITLKFQPRSTEDINERLCAALASVSDVGGKHVIIQRTRVRVRPLGF